MNLIPANPAMRKVMQSLRPPCARSTILTYGFSLQSNFNPGYTLRFPGGEQAVAPGYGIVTSVSGVVPFWSHSASSALGSGRPWQVIIDHGEGVSSVVHGLASVHCGVGQVIGRGDALGPTFADEVFFSVLHQGKAYNPSSVNSHFITQNGSQVIGQGGALRFAPDKIIRNLAGEVQTYVTGSLQFFVNLFCRVDTLLLNVDFNGNGTKQGAAVAGVTETDYWNVLAPLDFTSTASSSCYPSQPSGTRFSANPVVFINDFANRPSVVRLHRKVQQNFGGTDAFFDTMLSTYVGGYVGLTPRENTFEIRGLQGGTYALYLYANSVSGGNASTFNVSINGGAPTVKANTPGVSTVFVENENYVKFTLSLSVGDIVTVQALGFLSGMQVFKA